MKNAIIILNQSAGRKQAVKFKKLIHKFMMQNAEKHKFITIEEFNKENLEIFDTIIVVGGDGTINKVVPYIVENDKTLGIIPTGTANLLASKLGIPANPNKALQIIKAGKIKKVDILLINDFHSILRCGFGYDVDIIAKTPQSLKNKFGYFAYFIAGIIFALRLKPKHYDITLDGKNISVDASCLIVANAGNMYKNLFSVDNNSFVDDNLMNIFILKTKNPIVFLYEFIRIILGIKATSSRASYLSGEKLTINNTWAACHIDGEKKKLKGNINIEILNKAINILVK